MNKIWTSENGKWAITSIDKDEALSFVIVQDLASKRTHHIEVEHIKEGTTLLSGEIASADYDHFIDGGKLPIYVHNAITEQIKLTKTKQEQIEEYIQEFIDEELNFEDTSVGIYGRGYVDAELVKIINEEIEGFRVPYWGKYYFVIECEGIYNTVALKGDSESAEWVIDRLPFKEGDTITARDLVGINRTISIVHAPTTVDRVHKIEVCGENMVCMNYNENQNISFGADTEYLVTTANGTMVDVVSGSYLMMYGRVNR